MSDYPEGFDATQKFEMTYEAFEEMKRKGFWKGFWAGMFVCIFIFAIFSLK